ncbi:ABC transporter permease [uncultured Arcticibacterium sp.]|uniref:ABC transporter permease n=1 Tax=uncultured Arcticibacterium sp. TaxID=2173042 RepID=UPI0030FB92C3
MLKNYIKIAWRNLWKNKIYNGLNIVGLSIGLCSVLFALTFWSYERSFDNFHNKGIYRVTTSSIENEGEPHKTSAGTGQVQGPAFMKEVPELDSYVRVWGGDIMNEVRSGENILNLNTLFVDDNFTTFFNFPLLEGDKETALKKINSVVISEDAAMRLFGKKEGLIGELVYLDAEPSARRLGGKPLVVTAVAKNAPQNSSINFDILLSFRFAQLSFTDANWLNAYLGTFVKFDPKTNTEAIVPKLNAVYEKYAQAQLAESDFDPEIFYGLQPIRDMHLNSYLSENSWSMHEGGTTNESVSSYSNQFLGIALFIFLLALFNFINISISATLPRMREIGLRKMAGSSITGIYVQFLCETALLTLFAIGFALLLLMGLMPQFTTLTGVHVQFSTWLTLENIILLIAILGITSFLASFYPATYFAKITSKQSLFGKNKSPKLLAFGRVLLVFQFGIAFILAFFSITYYAQMKFMNTKDLGFNADNIIKAEIKGDRKSEPIKQFLENELATIPQFKAVTFGGTFGYEGDPTIIAGKKVNAIYRSIDQGFLSVMGLSLKSGKNIPNGQSHEILVNETFVKEAQLEQPIGSRLKLSNSIDENQKYYTIVGVIKDYHFESLRMKIKPQVLAYIPRHSSEILIKAASLGGFLPKFEAIYKKAMPLAAFEYDFLSEKNKQEYIREARSQKILGVATILAIVICCMGIFGLSHLNASYRIKEIGIRKVLGAKVSEITILLSSGFLKLIILAIIIASPIAYYLVNSWMQDFAYSVGFMWWVLPLVTFGALSITMLTVGFQAIKAALVSPVKSLRSE